MRKVKFIVVLLLSGVVIFSCRNKNERELGEVDALSDILNNTEELFLSVDTTKVFEIAKLRQDQMRIIQTTNDTLDKETAFFLASYFRKRKGIDKFVKSYHQTYADIQKTKDQLKNLRTDVENGLLSQEQFSEYYKTEQSIVVDLNNKISSSVNGIDIILKNVLEEDEKVNKIVDEIKQKQIGTISE